MTIFQPESEEQIIEAVRWAASAQEPFEIIGAGSKRTLGRPVKSNSRLSLAALRGISLYEPAELVMSVLPGTPLDEVESVLAEKGQQLAFEPPHPGSFFGVAEKKATLGGVFAANASGPRRFFAGAARDHLLGFKGVNGRGEGFKSGGRVVKNVTGYDLSKLMTGSFGTLAVLSELTFKVVPAPEETRTLVLDGLDDRQAIAAMTCALHSPASVSGAVHHGRDKRTALRLEGFSESVRARAQSLGRLLSSFGRVESLDDGHSRSFWQEQRDLGFMAPGPVVWRVALAPSLSARFADEIRSAFPSGLIADISYDWGGALIWIALAAGALADGGAVVIRAALKSLGEDAGGQATLFRAEEELRRQVAVFEPQEPALFKLTARVKDSFDPYRLFNPGRLYREI